MKEILLKLNTLTHSELAALKVEVTAKIDEKRAEKLQTPVKTFNKPLVRYSVR